MSQKNVIVVTGATGQVGHQVAERLLSAGHAVRAVARNVEKLKLLGERGADVRPGSLDDQPFLTSVFREASAVFAIIPTYTNWSPQDFFAEQTGYAQSLAGAIRESRVSHVIALTSWGAEVPDKAAGTIAPLRVFEDLLDHVPGLNAVKLRPGHFMEDRLWDIGLIKSVGILGSMLKPDLMLPMIATCDIAAVAADYLAKLNFQGRSVRYLLGPKDYTMTETARILGASIGKPDLRYVEFSEADFRKGLAGLGASPNFADLVVQMLHGFNTGLIKGEPRSKINTTPTTQEEFAKTTFAPAFKAAPNASVKE
jgi:uncharacterized protein YbjT (DUF2867 family)